MENESYKKPLVAYLAGFVLSILLTFLAYATVTNAVFPSQLAIGFIVFFAVVQLFVQLIFFLHLGQEAKPRWRWVTLGFGVLVVGILVFGSLWIMDNLNYNMMQSQEKMQEYMHKQGGY